MATANVIFHKCIQDSQEYGSDDEYMVSRVFFSIEVSKVEGNEIKVEKYDNLYTDLKQMVGGKFEENPIEVGFPSDFSGRIYSGPMNYEAFRNATESYFRSLVGTKGFGIHIEGGSGIRMHDSLFVKEHSAEFEAEDSQPR